MAICAAEIRVRVAQRKRSVNIMVKSRRRPGVTVVALAAILAKYALVGIVILMTSGALGFRIMEKIAGMAFAAGDGRVQAVEWERRKIVIKSQAPTPGSLRMTLTALLAELGPV